MYTFSRCPIEKHVYGIMTQKVFFGLRAMPSSATVEGTISTERRARFDRKKGPSEGLCCERKLGRHKCDNADLRKHIQLWDLELNNHRSRRSIIRTSRGKYYESIKKNSNFA